MQFQNKIVLISGAAQGIGAAIARQMAAEGAQLALLDIQDCSALAQALSMHSRPSSAQNPSPKPHLALQVNIADSHAVNAAVARVEAELGPIAILINAAAILRLGAALDCTDQDWQDTFNINLGGVFHLCRAVGRAMRARRSGVIISISSNAARIARQEMAAYAASKAAISHFMRCLGLELAQYGIRCNSLAPGSTDTAMQSQLWPAGVDKAAAQQAQIQGQLANYKPGIPLGRIAQAEDIADVACFLASDKARHITMQEICVDGGASL